MTGWYRIPIVSKLIAAALAVLATGDSFAQTFAPPVLTIEGRASATRQRTALDLSSEQIAALPHLTIETSTPWTVGKSIFKGVPLKDLIAYATMHGDRLQIVALNNYASEMRLSDVAEFALVAYEMNGKSMSVRDKGPLWIVFPFDSHPKLKSEQFYSRSVWQVRRIIVQDE